MLKGFSKHVRPQYQFDHLTYIGNSKILRDKPPDWHKATVDDLFRDFMEEDKITATQMLNAASYGGVIIDEKRYLKSLTKCDFPNIQPDDPRLDLAEDYIFKMLLPHCGGKRFSDKITINPKTSNGLPLQHMINPDTGKFFQNKGEFFKSSLFETEMEAGHDPIFSYFPKVELLPNEEIVNDEKMRGIFNGPSDFVAKQKHMYDGQDEGLKQASSKFKEQWSRYGYTKQFGGINNIARAHLALRKRYAKILHKMADVSGWDRRFPLMKRVYALRKRLYTLDGARPMSPEEEKLHNYIARNMSDPYCATFNGDIYQRHTGNVSGSGKTTSDNTIGHMIIEMYALIVLFDELNERVPTYEEVMDTTEISLYGDDDLSSYAWEFYAETIEKFIFRYKEIYKSFGLIIKDKAFKYGEDIEGLEFLGATFRRTNTGRFVGEPRWGKMAATLVWNINGRRDPYQYVSIIDALATLCYDVETSEGLFFNSFLVKYAQFLLRKLTGSLEYTDIQTLIRVANPQARYYDTLVHGFEGGSHFSSTGNHSDLMVATFPANFFFYEKHSSGQRAVEGFICDMEVKNNTCPPGWDSDPWWKGPEKNGDINRGIAVTSKEVRIKYSVNERCVNANYINFVDEQLVKLGQQKVFCSFGLAKDSSNTGHSCTLRLVAIPSNGNIQLKCYTYAASLNKATAKQVAYWELHEQLRSLRILTTVINPRPDQPGGFEIVPNRFDSRLGLDNPEFQKNFQVLEEAGKRERELKGDEIAVSKLFLKSVLENLRVREKMPAEHRSTHLFSTLFSLPLDLSHDMFIEMLKQKDCTVLDFDYEGPRLGGYPNDGKNSYDDIACKMQQFSPKPGVLDVVGQHFMVHHPSMDEHNVARDIINSKRNNEAISRTLAPTMSPMDSENRGIKPNFNFNMLVLCFLCVVCLLPITSADVSVQAQCIQLNSTNWNCTSLWWGDFQGGRNHIEGSSSTLRVALENALVINHDEYTVTPNSVTAQVMRSLLADTIPGSFSPVLTISDPYFCYLDMADVFGVGVLYSLGEANVIVGNSNLFVECDHCCEFFEQNSLPATVPGSFGYTLYCGTFCNDTESWCSTLNARYGNNTGSLNKPYAVGSPYCTPYYSTVIGREEPSFKLPEEGLVFELPLNSAASYVASLWHSDEGARSSKEFRNGFNPYGNGQPPPKNQTYQKFHAVRKNKGWSEAKIASAWADHNNQKPKQIKAAVAQPKVKKANKKNTVPTRNIVPVIAASPMISNKLSACAATYAHTMVHPFWPAVSSKENIGMSVPSKVSNFMEPYRKEDICIPFPPLKGARSCYTLKRNISVTVGEDGCCWLVVAFQRFANDYATTNSAGNGSSTAPPIITSSDTTFDWNDTFGDFDDWDTTTLPTTMTAYNFNTDYTSASLAPIGAPTRGNVPCGRVVAGGVEFYGTGKVIDVAGVMHLLQHPQHGSLSGISPNGVSNWPSYFSKPCDKNVHTLSYCPVHQEEYEWNADYSQKDVPNIGPEVIDSLLGNHSIGFMVTGATPGYTFNCNLILHMEVNSPNIIDQKTSICDYNAQGPIRSVITPSTVGAISEAPGVLEYFIQHAPNTVTSFVNGMKEGANVNGAIRTAGMLLGRKLTGSFVNSIVG